MPEIKRRVRLEWACYSRFKRELYDMKAAPFTLKVRMLKAEVMETLLYACVTWTLGKEHFAELRTAQHRFLLRISGFQRRQRTDHLMYAKALKKPQCESVETIIRKRLVDLRAFRAAEESTESVPFMFGVETVLWPTAAKTREK